MPAVDFSQYKKKTNEKVQEVKKVPKKSSKKSSAPKKKEIPEDQPDEIDLLEAMDIEPEPVNDRTKHRAKAGESTMPNKVPWENLAVLQGVIKLMGINIDKMKIGTILKAQAEVHTHKNDLGVVGKILKNLGLVLEHL
jgi:outer membrane biosynthesis protein TonB